MTAAVQVPWSNIAGMVFSLIVAWGMPTALFILIRRRWRADIRSFFLGCGGFFLFAMLLEQLFHMVVLFGLGAVSQAIKDNLWLYAIYGGFAAGVFEESGRYLIMRFLMKKSLTRENAVMYGAGHGGMEAVLILGMTSINNLVNSMLLNSGSLTEVLTEDLNTQAVLDSLTPLSTLPAWQFFLGGAERIIAIGLQIALSLLVYQAVKEKKSWYFFPLAILLHMLVDAVVLLISNHGSLVITELVALFGAAAIGYLAWVTVWKRKNVKNGNSN